MADAEHSWMQDAADDLMDEMMKKFNKDRCVVWSTLQMYRHDRLEFLKKIHRKSVEENYFIGFKIDRKSTRLNSSHVAISYAVFCLKKKKKEQIIWCKKQ